MVETTSASPVALRATVSRDFGAPVGRVLDGFSVECRAGEILAVVGASGCGKSTLLRSLAEAQSTKDKPDEQKVGYAFAFQEPELIPWRDASGNARFESEMAEEDEGKAEGRAAEMLQLVGLSEASKLFPHELSTGMKQRLQLARVIARKTPIVLLDEPLAAVDQPSRLVIARALRERFKQDASAVVWVTHDLLEALSVADRILAVGGRPLAVIREMRVTPDDRPHAVASSQGCKVDSPVEALLQALEKKAHFNAGLEAPLPAQRANSASQLSVPAGNWKIHAIQALLFFGLVCLWELAIFARPQLGFFLPPPHDWVIGLLRRLATTDLSYHAWVTLREAMGGLAIGFTAGTLLGYTAEISESTGRAMRPLWVGLTAVPLFVLAPAFIVWFGIGESMKVALAACSAAPFAAVAVLDSVFASHGRFFDYMKANRVRRHMLFTRYVLPHTLAAWFLGSRAGAVAALLGAFLGEFISADRGLGYIILLDAGRYRLGDVLGGVLLLFLIAVTVDAFLKRLGSRRHHILYRLKV